MNSNWNFCSVCDFFKDVINLQDDIFPEDNAKENSKSLTLLKLSAPINNQFKLERTRPDPFPIDMLLTDFY